MLAAMLTVKVRMAVLKANHNTDCSSTRQRITGAVTLTSDVWSTTAAVHESQTLTFQPSSASGPSRRSDGASSGARQTVQAANFVAVGVAQVGQVQLAVCTFARAGRVFARGTAVGQPSGVPRLGLFG